MHQPVNAKRLVIGLGTGRSGTTSLANLLNAQPDSFVVHEGSLTRQNGNHTERYDYLLPWEKNVATMRSFLDEVVRQSGDASVYGSVALYFLPYVHDIIAEFPNARFIRIVRNRDEVIKSFDVHSGPYHWWSDHDGKKYRRDPVWDPSFPKFEAATKQEAIGKYYDMYTIEGARLEEQYPDRFATFDIKALNTTEGMHAILDFAGYPRENRVIQVMKDNSAYTPTKTIKRWARLLYLDRAYRFFKKMVQ